MTNPLTEQNNPNNPSNNPDNNLNNTNSNSNNITKNAGFLSSVAKLGDRVKISLKNQIEEGILMPSPNKDITLIKLDTGYNLGFETKNILQITPMKSPTSSNQISEPKLVVKNKSSLPSIAVLHTGGTIASKADYRTGGVTAAFSPEDLLSMYPELYEIASIKSEGVAQMWSDDLRFSTIIALADAIPKYVTNGCDGIIIGIGTDNLAVASAALSFIIEKSPVPILLVGSQRSSDRGSADAAMNLICAAKFITKTDFAGVAICMHSSPSDDRCAILPACKTTKLHSSRRDAFKPVNSNPIAFIDYKTGKIEYSNSNYPKADSVLEVKANLEEKVGILKIHANMFKEQFLAFKGFKGLILEGTGLGHTPLHVPNPDCHEHEKIRSAIKELIDSGTIIVMTTQCLFGEVNMNVYDKGRDLLEMGIVSGKDMLASTAQIKLSWLLANYTDKQKIKHLMTQNLRGEISERLEFKDNFLI